MLRLDLEGALPFLDAAHARLEALGLATELSRSEDVRVDHVCWRAPCDASYRAAVAATLAQVLGRRSALHAPHPVRRRLRHPPM